jgi:hypothetical protein
MSNNNQGGGGFWVVVALLLGLSAIMQMLGGSGGGSSTVSSSPAGVDRGSFEHRYATERLKQEGYSQSESQQAADAIIKFHNAQQNRNK